MSSVCICLIAREDTCDIWKACSISNFKINLSRVRIIVAFQFIQVNFSYLDRLVVKLTIIWCLNVFKVALLLSRNLSLHFTWNFVLEITAFQNTLSTAFSLRYDVKKRVKKVKTLQLLWVADKFLSILGIFRTILNI